VTKVTLSGGVETGRAVLGTGLACPPCNIGPRSTPNYHQLGQEAIHTLGGGVAVFAGQRRDGFYVDLGAIFDLGDLRPFQNLHLIPTAPTKPLDALRSFNVHSIALQVPKTMLTSDGSNPTNVMSATSVIGVWTTASRQKSTVIDTNGTVHHTGPWVQVSRLGNPLFNEVIVPMAEKDKWNALPPIADAAFAKYVNHPELGKLIPVLYPGVFPHLAGLTAARADLNAILLTGIPGGIVPGFQNFTGTTPADLLRLNMAIPPSSNPSALGLLGGDLAGFPNGRRVADDIVTIELRAIAGVTYPLVNPSYMPDGAASVVTDGVDASPNVNYAVAFPYLSDPKGGYEVRPLA
jgi:hypothetical protein